MMKRYRPCRKLRCALGVVFALVLAFGQCSAVSAEALPKTPVPSKWGYENFKDYMPDLRSQGKYGTCWAMSAIAMAEISLGRQEIMVRPDLSEVQLAYFYYHWQPDPLGGTAGDINLADFGPGQNYLNNGLASVLGPARVLATWTGVARDEGILKYPSDEGPIQGTIDPRYAYADVAHLRAFYRAAPSPYKPGAMQEAKRIIMETGALGAQFYAPDDVANIYNAKTNAFYDYNVRGTNHVVTIVGWDDHFSRDSFIVKPPHDGAWLVRNSWAVGPYEKNQDYSGYFWMSYYNPSLEANAVALVFDPVDRYDNNYQYDGCVPFEALDIPLDTCHSANVFRAKAADLEDLVAASFYSETIGGDYTIHVYVSDTPMGASPESGTLKAVKTGIIPHSGYHTVDLDSPVKLKRGQYFSIVLTVHNGNEKMVNIARERSRDEPGWDLKTTAAIQPGQSFFRTEGEAWEDICDSGREIGAGNMCIKAFTKNRAAPPETPPPVVPKTGDGALPALWLAMLLGGTACLCVPALRKRRR